MPQKLGKKILIYSFVLIIFGTFNNQKFSGQNFFEIKNFVIETTENTNFLEIPDKLFSLKKLNIFLINKKKIREIIEANSLVESYFIKKKYPSEIKIKIIQTKFVSKVKINKKNFLVGTNGKLIEDLNNINDLPFIFGKPSIKQILDLNNIIQNSKFNYYEFSNLFYYKSGRWDLESRDGFIIKLPAENLSQKLEEIYDIVSNKNFAYKKIIDARVTNQIILYD